MKRVAAWWFAPAPAERLAALRILIGAYALGYVVVRLPELARVARLPSGAFEPVGIVRVLGAPLPPSVVVAIAIVTCALLVAFVLGIAFSASAPLAALGLAWTLGYRNAWGQVFHTENLMLLHVIALACSPAADAWALRRAPAAPNDAGHGWAIKLLVALTAVTYVLAGIAKLRLAGVHWLAGDQLRDQIAFDNLRKAVLGDPTAPLAIPMLEHPSLCLAVSIATIGLELGAPILLLGGRVARTWVAASWVFHLGVVLTMYILFPYPLFGFAYLPVFAVERPLRWIARRSGVIDLSSECQRVADG